MPPKYLVLEVRVIEMDKDGNILACHSQHREHYKEQAVEQREDLIRWAYKGFNVARNGFLGVPEREKE